MSPGLSCSQYRSQRPPWQLFNSFVFATYTMVSWPVFLFKNVVSTSSLIAKKLLQQCIIVFGGAWAHCIILVGCIGGWVWKFVVVQTGHANFLKPCPSQFSEIFCQLWLDYDQYFTILRNHQCNDWPSREELLPGMTERWLDWILAHWEALWRSSCPDSEKCDEWQLQFSCNFYLG